MNSALVALLASRNRLRRWPAHDALLTNLALSNLCFSITSIPTISPITTRARELSSGAVSGSICIDGRIGDVQQGIFGIENASAPGTAIATRGAVAGDVVAHRAVRQGEGA